jgi:hypothetical protein
LLPFSSEPPLFSPAVEETQKIITDKTILLHVVLYGCDTWSLILGEEHRLRVFENGALRKIFGLKRDEVTGGWRKLHNEELHDCTLRQIIKPRKMGRTGHVARMGKKAEKKERDH